MRERRERHSVLEVEPRETETHRQRHY